MDGFIVKLPMDRLVALSTMLGSMDADLCPPIVGHDCWLKRGLAPYTNGQMPEYECTECWMRYILMGD